MDFNTLATWYVHDDPSESWEFPQLESRSGSTFVQNTYLKCACVSLASARKAGVPKLQFFTNLKTLPEPYSGILSRLNVELITLPCVTRGQKAWGNQFYIFDIIDYLSALDAPGQFMIVDSDCIILPGVLEAFAAIRRYGCLAYDLRLAASNRMNGLSGQDMRLIANDVFGESREEPVRYAGGEVFLASMDVVRAIAAERPTLGKIMTKFAEMGGGEEAHALSILYDHLGFPSGTANAWVERLWTNFRFNNVPHDVLNSSLAILHLPSEKRTGFNRAFDRLLRGEFVPGSVAEDFRLPRRSLSQSLVDISVLAPSKIAKKLGL